MREIPPHFAILFKVRAQVLLVQLLPLVQECSAACYESLCMQMEAPYLADSL